MQSAAKSIIDSSISRIAPASCAKVFAGTLVVAHDRRPMAPGVFDDDFLLETETARVLYHEHAESQPIIDYHCHLPPEQIAANHRFRSITGVWLDGDHYKWRAMRTNGVPEEYCTGKRTDFEKFEAWARTVPKTLRNPLFHWTHLELKRTFGVKKLLDEKSAKEIFEHTNQLVAKDEYTTQGLLKQSRVLVVCSTDDPADSLEHHTVHAASPGARDVRLYPTWRPDKALAVEDPKGWNEWLGRLEKAVGTQHSHVRRAHGGARKAPHVFSRARLPAFGPRARNDVCRRLLGFRRALGVRAGAARRSRHGRGRDSLQVRDPSRARAPRSRPRLGAAIPPRCASQQQHAPAHEARARHRIRLDRRLRSRPPARSLSRSSRSGRQARAHHPLQPEPARQRSHGHHDRQLPGRLGPRKDAVRELVVVPRSARRHGEADERALQHGPALALRGHADRFAEFPLVLAPRVLPPPALQHAR